MAAITRRIGKKGLKIQALFYISAELGRLTGHLVSVEVPEGPLPQTLVATHEAQSLVIHDSSRLLARIDVETLAAHIQQRHRNLDLYRNVPFRKQTYL